MLTHQLNRSCEGNLSSDWIGFELDRNFEVIEKLTLGKERANIKARMWDPQTVRCIKKLRKGAKIILFGVNTKKDFVRARSLGVYAIFCDTLDNL